MTNFKGKTKEAAKIMITHPQGDAKIHLEILSSRRSMSFFDYLIPNS